MKFIIEGVHPYDGTYEFDKSHLTNREIRKIKLLTGLRPLEYEEAGNAGDNDLGVAMVIIALQRSGRFAEINEDLIWDADLGKITADLTDEVAADPPALEPEALGSPSGSSSPTVGDENPVRSLRPTGTGFSEP